MEVVFLPDHTKELYQMDLNPDKLLLVWQDLLATAQASVQTAQTQATAKSAVILMQNHPTTSTLTAQSNILDSGVMALGISDPENQAPAKPRFATVTGNTGQLNYSYPLTLAPGPEGTVPQLAATYSSGDTNSRKSPRSPADSVGEGWSLTMGSVTEEKEGGGSLWYFLNGVDNVSDRLIPDSSTVAAGTNFATEHLSYVKVQMVDAGFDSQQCFHVWDTEGNYYEFGCTPGSLQYYTDGNNNRTNYRYDLDQMIPANEGTYPMRVLNVSYLHDAETDSNGHYSITDAVIKQITYGTSTATDIGNHVTTNIAGTVDFFYKGANADTENGVQWVTAYGTNEGGCTPPDGLSVTERCDDPHDKSGGLSDPLVMSKFSLSTVKTYVGDDSSNSHLDYSYALTYQDTPFTNCTDPLTGTNAYCAGNHLLTSITPTVYQNGAGQALPGMSFGYNDPTKEQRTNKYEDTSQSVPQGGDYKVQTNWRYLVNYHDHSNGVGANIVYHTAYNNSNGTPHTSDGDNRYDPFFCVWHSTECTQSPFSPTYNKMWTEQVVYQIISTGKDSSASTLTPATTTYHYLLAQTTGSCAADAASPPNSDCVGFGWIPTTSDGWQDFYHGEFRGFSEVDITNPDGTLTVQKYYATEGWNSAQSDAKNYLGGHLYEEDVYQGGTISANTLLKQTLNTYAGTNNTATSCASGYVSGYYKPCEVILLTSRTTTFEQTGSSNANAPWEQHDYTYDDYNSSGWATGKYHNLTKEVISTSNAPTIMKNMNYATTNTIVSGHVYYTVHNLIHSELVDASNHTWQCQDTAYDEGVGSGVPQPAAGWPTTITKYRTCGDNTTALKTYTGYNSDGDIVATVDALAVSTPSLYTTAGCTLSSPPTIFPTTNWSSSHYTSCMQYNSNGQPTSTWNALGQGRSIAYDPTQGLLPTTMTDLNGLNTTTIYNYTGGNSTIQIKAPAESGSYTSQTRSQSSCTDSSTLPCFEVDSNSSQYTGAITRTFYDNLGRITETRTKSADASFDLVTFTVHDDSKHSVFESVPFAVQSTLNNGGWVDPNGAVDYQSVTPGGTMTYYDALDRPLGVKDPLYGSSQEPGIACPGQQEIWTGCTFYGLGNAHGDPATYAYATVLDPNNHARVSFTDALGRLRYMQTYSGTGLSSVTTNVTSSRNTQYNAIDATTSVNVTDLAPQSGQNITSVTTNNTYNDLGWLLTSTDPDKGNHSMSYDAEGHILSNVSGSRTLGYNYDLLGRIGCVQDILPTVNATGACTNGGHPYVQNTYDRTFLGTQGSSDFPIGELTQSVATTYYPDGTQASVTEQLQHDQRERITQESMQITVPGSWGVTTALPTYQIAMSYNDIDQQTTTTTSTNPAGQGYTTTNVYDTTTGMLKGLSNSGAATANLATVSYNARGLQDTIAFQTATGTALASEQFQYNANLRPITTTASWQSGSGLTGNIFTQNRSYDPGGNVISLSTMQAVVVGQSGSGGSISENYCYDEQDRLVWAGNSGSQPGSGNGTCGNAALANSINGATYSNGFVYTNLGSSWQGPLKGSATQYQYLYCDSTHPHQLTGVYTAGTTCATKSDSNRMYSTAYDAWGNVTSRYLSGTTATLSYDALDQLVQWDAGSNSREWYIYDASGNRVLRRVTNGSSISLIVYAFGVEELHYDGTGSNQSNIYYYSLGGRLLGSLDSNGTHFFFTDALGSVLSSINASSGAASLQGVQGFGPYGNALYQQGDMGTVKGYTGQYTDSNTGLDFYNARYYDPAIGRFLSADPVQGNLQGADPYSYVGDNPETRNDPTGYCDFICDVGHFFRDVGHAVTRTVHTVTHWFNQESHFAQQVGEQVAKQAAKVLPKWVIPVVVVVVVVSVFVWHAVTGATQKAQPPQNHPWTPNAQRRLAHQTAQQIHDHRQAQYGGKGDKAKTSFGRASISATDNDGKVIDKSQSGFIRGDNNLTHTEQAQAIWVKNELKTRYKNTPAGSTINIMIFTQSYPCAERCQPGLPRWIQDIKNSAPKGVFVNVYVWYQPTFDKDDALGNPPNSDQDVSPYSS